MPEPTPTNGLDRKLHLIVLAADPEEYKTAIALARAVEEERADAFRYSRDGKVEYTRADTISGYVAYARNVGLLDGNLGSTSAKADIRSLGNFQAWLSDVVFTFLQTNNASLDQVAGAVETLLSSRPFNLPTLPKVHGELGTSMSVNDFRLSLKLIALLRPKALRLLSRRLVIIPALMAS